MAEIPDFDRLARETYDTCTLQGWADKLRQIWNARGAADQHAVTIRSVELFGTASGSIYADHYIKPIRALDK